MVLDLERDRDFLTWLFSQFLYGEVTGIQCGHWLMRAPTLEAATFIARQSVEELSHVKRMHRILGLLHSGQKLRIEPVHPVVRFLSTGMMSKDWAHHVTIEMALGERMVLEMFKILEASIQHPEIKSILQSAIPEETRHAEFGHREALKWLRKHPRDRRHLRTQVLIQEGVLRAMRWWMRRRWSKSVSSELAAFMNTAMDQVLNRFLDQVDALGLVAPSTSAAPKSLFQKMLWVAIGLLASPWDRWNLMRRRPRPLTDTYREDPWLEDGPMGSRNSNVNAY